MPGKIFISYRRDDVAGDARSIRDGLAIRFGRHSVFMDVDDLLLGQRFDRELAKALDGCDLLIAAIGPRWMELLKAKAARTERDYVRLEIAEALRRGIVVVPVLVGRIGQMPTLPAAEDLPEDIRDLTWHQKHDVTHERFARDLADLSNGIAGTRQDLRWRLSWQWVSVCIGAIALAGVVWTFRTDIQAMVRRIPHVASIPEAPDAPQAPLPPAPQKRISPTRAVAMLTAEEERLAQPKDTFKECSVCPEMVVVPAGAFTMGSPPGEVDREPDEGPPQRISIPRPFAIGKFEVTRGELAAFLTAARRSAGDFCHIGQIASGQLQERAGHSFHAPGFAQSDRHPVVCVSIDDATAFAGWLSELTGKTYRLPTEAEWEYAARAGTTTRYAVGNAITTRFAKYSGSVWGSAGGTAAVGSFPPNGLGLYDMHGNVWEWVQDCWHSTYDGQPADGSAWTAGDCGLRVVRGGGWISHPQDLRSANRFKYPAFNRYNILGFRLVRPL